jgi:hypothetical protein
LPKGADIQYSIRCTFDLANQGFVSLCLFMSIPPFFGDIDCGRFPERERLFVTPCDFKLFSALIISCYSREKRRSVLSGEIINRVKPRDLSAEKTCIEKVP